jgi:hypothetical protein
MALEAELGSFSGALHLRAKPAVVKRSATFLNVLRANTWPARIDSRLDPLIRRWSFLFVCEKGNADANAYYPTGLGGRDEAAIARDDALVFAWILLVIAIIAYAVGYLMVEQINPD